VNFSRIVPFGVFIHLFAVPGEGKLFTPLAGKAGLVLDISGLSL
jgi:hypothetical protein